MATDAEMRVIRAAIALRREETTVTFSEVEDAVDALFADDPAWICDERKDET